MRVVVSLPGSGWIFAQMNIAKGGNGPAQVFTTATAAVPINKSTLAGSVVILDGEHVWDVPEYQRDYDGTPAELACDEDIGAWRHVDHNDVDDPHD